MVQAAEDCRQAAGRLSVLDQSRVDIGGSFLTEK
jgi:hypothetical protein